MSNEGKRFGGGWSDKKLDVLAEYLRAYTTVMAVNRMLPRSGVIPDEWAAKLTETFGNDDWRDVFFQTQPADLFGMETTSKTLEPFQKLSEYVTGRLGSVFAGVVDAPLLLRN